MTFSERFGFKSVREVVQLDSMDAELRNSLWSLLTVYVWENATTGSSGYLNDSRIKTLCQLIWFNLFKSPLDEIPPQWHRLLGQLRAHFFAVEWYEVYDFVEFVANNYGRPDFKEGFVTNCNGVLEKEMSAYRFVDGLIAKLTDETEIDEIELAAQQSDSLVRVHLQRALELLSNRTAPDYRNSIKESVSAVESLVGKVTGVEKGTLGQLIKELKDSVDLHPALEKAFSSLYGYTSDAGGIRHALMDKSTVDFADAKFMLVVCSAFVNFVTAKLA